MDINTDTEVQDDDMEALPVNKEPTNGCLLSLKIIRFTAVCVPLLLPRCASGPANLGFWCNDPSLIFPYKPDTVSAGKLMLYSVGGPFLVIASNEVLRAFIGAGFGWCAKNIVFIQFKAYCIFLFGLVIVILFTESIKCTVGELRPDFFAVCKPDFSKLNCTDKNGITREEEEPVDYRPIKFPSDVFTEPIIDAPDLCKDVHLYDALMTVHTAIPHFDRRNDYRLTYGNYEFTKPYKIKIVFFMGIPEDLNDQGKIVTENIFFQDTIQGNFTDTYQNLTYKAVMAFRWVAVHCKDAKMILKMDDDVILDVHRFFEEFPYPPQYQQELIFCHMWMLAEVERKGKWAISLLEYSQEYYPPYCSGFFVVIMPAIVEDIYQAAKATPFLWLDDVFIYGVVREEMHFVQIVNLDEVAFREEHYSACYKSYGYRYIQDYTCTGELADEKRVKDSRMSFPSGHASIGTFSAIYVALYLELRMYITESYFLRPALQSMFLLMATLNAMTRITDHKHHYMDIIAGGFIGGTVAGLIFYRIAWKVIPIPLSHNTPALSMVSSMETENGVDLMTHKVGDTTTVKSLIPVCDVTACLSTSHPKSPSAV